MRAQARNQRTGERGGGGHRNEPARQHETGLKQRQTGVADEEIGPDQHDRERHQIHRRAGKVDQREASTAKQPDLNDRLCRPSLPGHEPDEARRSRGQHRQPEIVSIGQARQPVDRKQQAGEAESQQYGPHNIEALGTARLAGGFDPPRQAAQQQQAGQRDRRPKPEHRRPAPARHQQPADHRPHRGAEREHQGEDPEGMAAPPFGIEARHQRRGAADDQPGADPLQEPEEQQPAETWRRRAQQKSADTPQQPGAEHPGVAPHIADAPEGEHQPGMGQDVADDDPLDHRDRQAEAAGNIGEGDVDGGVERHDRNAEPDQHQPKPIAGFVPQRQGGVVQRCCPRIHCAR